MEKLPVKLLTELLTVDEMIAADNVKKTHEVRFCPIGVSLPDESRITLKYQVDNERFSEFRYTPQAYFAIRVWETARDNLLQRPEFVGALDIEWYPVAASFNSVRFVNGGTEKFIAAMFEEMKRVADSHMIEIRYGRFDAPAIPARPDRPRRYYIMTPELMAKKWGWRMKDELNPLQNIPAGNFSWKDIEDAFVVLKPIQLAFIAGYEMNRSTPLDDEFFLACGKFDLEKVKELVAKGANIHAVGPFGSSTSALAHMIECYSDFSSTADEHGSSRSLVRTKERLVEIARYLLSLGYNFNIAGYGGTTCMYDAIHSKDIDIVKFILDNGADPNVSLCNWSDGAGTALEHVWHDGSIYEDQDYHMLSLLLLRYGALPVPKGIPFGAKMPYEWFETSELLDIWNEIIAERKSNFDVQLIADAKRMCFYHVALIATNGGNVNVRDALGRNLLQIVLEEAELTENKRKYFKMDLAEMALMLLCGLKLKLSAAEIEQAKATCREKGYAEALDAIASVTAPK